VRMLCLVADEEHLGEWKARPACVPSDLHEIRRVSRLVWRRASVRAEHLVPPRPQIGLLDGTDQELLPGLVV